MITDQPAKRWWEEKRLAACRKSAFLRRGIPTGRPPQPKTLKALAEWKKNNPDAVKAIAMNNLPKNCTGIKNGNWKGGITEATRGRRSTSEYKKWRASVIKRDGFKCRECGTDSQLQVHHIIPMSVCEEICTLRMNGVTLCQPCHFKNDPTWHGQRHQKIQSIGNSIAYIFSIPHKFHEYPTVGNWQLLRKGVPVIFVSSEIGDKFALLVALHELIEVTLCEERGITCEQVDTFDKSFELHRPAGNEDEPGDDPAAPYQKEHFFATSLERLMAAELGVDWKKYDEAIMKLP